MSQQYIGVLGTPGPCQRGPGDQRLEKSFNPNWNKNCQSEYGNRYSENFKVFRSKYDYDQQQGHNPVFEHDKSVQEYYAPSCRNCKAGCNCTRNGTWNRSLAFDNPYNWNSYYTSGHVVPGNKKENFLDDSSMQMHVMLHGQDAPDGPDDGGMY